MQSTGFHITSLCVLLLLSSIGKPSPIAFVRIPFLSNHQRSLPTYPSQWRYILFAAMFIYELIFILSPSSIAPSSTPISPFIFTDSTTAVSNSFFSFLWPNRVAYQHVRFLHSLSILLSVALSRVAPVLFPETVFGGDLNPRMWIGELSKIRAAAQVASDGSKSSRGCRRLCRTYTDSFF